MKNQKIEIKLLQAIADGIHQLYIWDRIRSEVEVPEVYTFRYKNTDYTIEKGTDRNESLYLLKNDGQTRLVGIFGTDMHGLIESVKVFATRADLLDYTEYKATYVTKKAPPSLYKAKQPRPRIIYQKRRSPLD